MDILLNTFSQTSLCFSKISFSCWYKSSSFACKSSVFSVPSDTDEESAFPTSPFPVHAVNDNATQSVRIMIIVLLVFIIKNLLLFVIKFYKLIVDCIFWTSFHTGTASYTFQMIWTLYNINIHFTYFCALMTSNAFIIFNLYAEK